MSLFILIQLMGPMFKCFRDSTRHDLNLYGTWTIILVEICFFHPFLWFWTLYGSVCYAKIVLCSKGPVLKWLFLIWLVWNFIYFF